MPLVRIDVQEGRSPEQLRRLADVVQEVMLEVFDAPDRDRYQIVSVVANERADWSFGLGRAQFLEGDL